MTRKVYQLQTILPKTPCHIYNASCLYKGQLYLTAPQHWTPAPGNGNKITYMSNLCMELNYRCHSTVYCFDAFTQNVEFIAFIGQIMLTWKFKVVDRGFKWKWMESVCLATKHALIQNRFSIKTGFVSSIEATKLDLAQNGSIQILLSIKYWNSLYIYIYIYILYIYVFSLYIYIYLQFTIDEEYGWCLMLWSTPLSPLSNSSISCNNSIHKVNLQQPRNVILMQCASQRTVLGNSP